MDVDHHRELGQLHPTGMRRVPDVVAETPAHCQGEQLPAVEAQPPTAGNPVRSIDDDRAAVSCAEGRLRPTYRLERGPNRGHRAIVAIATRVFADPPTSRVATMGGPLLVVLAGRPGTGKTTLAGRLAHELRAAYVRTDAIATVLLGSGLAGSGVTADPATAGRAAYAVAHEVVAGTLRAGVPVVVDAVNATGERRASWRDLAHRTGARLVVFETRLDDSGEHRRRVEHRRPDLAGQIVATWAQVQAQPYEAWDERRDGSRLVIDTSDLERGISTALQLLA